MKKDSFICLLKRVICFWWRAGKKLFYLLECERGWHRIKKHFFPVPSIFHIMWLYDSRKKKLWIGWNNCLEKRISYDRKFKIKKTTTPNNTLKKIEYYLRPRQLFHTILLKNYLFIFRLDFIFLLIYISLLLPMIYPCG